MILILITIYVLSVFFSWLYIHYIYSKEGIFPSSSVNNFNIILVFFPVLNTIHCLFWLLQWPITRKRKYKRPRDLNKFFKIN